MSKKGDSRTLSPSALSLSKGLKPADATPYLSSSGPSHLSLPALISNNKSKRSPSLISTHKPTPVMSFNALSGACQKDDCITMLHASALASSSNSKSPPHSVSSSRPISRSTSQSRTASIKSAAIPISASISKCGNSIDQTALSPTATVSVSIASPMISVPEATNGGLKHYASFSPQIPALGLDSTDIAESTESRADPIVNEVALRTKGDTNETLPEVVSNFKWSYWKRTSSFMSLSSENCDSRPKTMEKNHQSTLSNESAKKKISSELKDSESTSNNVSSSTDCLKLFSEVNSSTMTQAKSWVSWIPYMGTELETSKTESTSIPVTENVTKTPIQERPTQVEFFDQNVGIGRTQKITIAKPETPQLDLDKISTTQNEKNTILDVDEKPPVENSNTSGWLWNKFIPGGGKQQQLNNIESVKSTTDSTENLKNSSHTTENIIKSNKTLSDSEINLAKSIIAPSTSATKPTNEIIPEPIENTTEITLKTKKSWMYWFSKDSDTTNNASNNQDHEQNSEFSDNKNSQISPLETYILPSFSERNDNSTKTKSGPERDGDLRRPNLVLPLQDICFPVHSKADTLKHTAKYIKHLCLGPSNKPGMMQINTNYPHLYRTNKPSIIKKAVVIGIHGFFPAKLVRSVLGEPTGTSTKFANEAADALTAWGKRNGITMEIEKIALDGEGKVFERTENLYELLFEWIEQIHECDFLFFAAHSQGTPVAVHILAKLIEEGHIFDNKKLGVLGMAGISLGPFYGLDQKLLMRAYSSIESASLKELFQFQTQSSFQSRKYTHALKVVIAHNTKITFIGSINDQLVPLYSSTCIHITHPNVYRAVYIDGTDVTPGFISDLVSLALHIRNIGASDHDLIRELSGALAGALTSGGHSKIYNEPNVYDLAIINVLETTNCENDLPLLVEDNFQVPNTNHNPFHLPWAMRSMLYEVISRPILEHHLEVIRIKFNEWEPETKALKDLKYRLSSINTRM